jgi:signal transduction histidine kinase
VRERAGRRGITLDRALHERVGMIRGDERKVKQVTLNLLSNAIKFTPEGGRIDVRAAVTEGFVEVSVADTGVGIAPEDQETVPGPETPVRAFVEGVTARCQGRGDRAHQAC